MRISFGWMSMCPNNVEKKNKSDILQKFHYILKNNPAIIYSSSIGNNWAATFISENVRTQLGYEPRQFTEEPDFWVSHLHPDDTKRVLATLETIFKTDFCTYDYRFLTKDGKYIWLYDEVRLIRDENGKPIETVGFIIDITERKKAEEELLNYDKQLHELVRKRTAELEEANKALLKREKQFQYEKIIAEEARKLMEMYFDFMTHDITNMVTPISLYTEIIIRSEEFPEDARDYLIKLYNQIMRLDIFLLRIRILAEAENLPPWKSDSLDLSDAISEFKTILERRYPMHQINFEYHLPAGETVESIGGRYFREAILEVLDNAVKHSTNNLVRIELVASPIIGINNEPSWLISIADNGPGIPRNMMGNLTKPFDISKRDQRGVASGLSFASTIIEHFGGRIWIEDLIKEGTVKGSICFIEIPKYASKRQRKKAKSSSPQ